jgi:uncharacterized protein (TIGR00297 family)
VLAAIVILIARRQGALSPSGAAAALVAGTICAAAGWSWAILLATFFVSANALSLYRRSAKAALIGDMIEKGGERDAWQVAANGGVFAALAAAALFHPSPVWLAAGAGAISAATADTWATEVGTLADHPPKLITTGRPVPAGTSGAVTWRGSFAGLAGAVCIAAVALLAGAGPRTASAAIAGGVAGPLVDSIVGTFQRRQWCERCAKPTERLVHSCGMITTPNGGVSWLDNDIVNVLSSLTGAVAGSILLR